MNESQLIRTTIHVGAMLYPLLAMYMIYLKPEGRMEWAVTVKTVAFTLVFWRIIQVYYYDPHREFVFYGMLAWGLLMLSFFFTLFAVVTTAFGRRGRKEARKERIKGGIPGFQMDADLAAESASETAAKTVIVAENTRKNDGTKP